MIARYPWHGTTLCWYNIFCVACEAIDGELCHSIESAEGYFRQRGWHQEQGLWCCPNCRQDGGVKEGVQRDAE